MLEEFIHSRYISSFILKIILQVPFGQARLSFEMEQLSKSIELSVHIDREFKKQIGNILNEVKISMAELVENNKKVTDKIIDKSDVEYGFIGLVSFIISSVIWILIYLFGYCWYKKCCRHCCEKRQSRDLESNGVDLNLFELAKHQSISTLPREIILPTRQVDPESVPTATVEPSRTRSFRS